MLRKLFGGLLTGRDAQDEFARARSAFDTGAYEEAERLCAARAAADPRFVPAQHLLALIALRRGQLEPALARLRRAAEIGAAPTPFHAQLGAALHELGANKAAAHHLTQAIDGAADGDPARAELMLLLVDALVAEKRFAQAEQVLRELLAADPDLPDALERLASIRYFESDGAQARDLMDRYIALRPGAGPRLRRALMMPVILQSNEEIDAVRARLDRDLDELLDARLDPIRDPEGEVGLTAFYLAYHGRPNRELLRKFGRVCRALYPANTESPRRAAARGRRLRIGFVSTFFYTHSVGRTTYGLIKDLPRGDFEVHVFAIAPQPGETAEEIRAAADRYVALPRELGQVRAAIEAAELDILLFADVGMNPLTTFLALSRLAPLQLNTWGHSVTSGIDTLDYYVSADQVEAPGSEDQYSEKLMRLPGYFMPRYHRPRLPGRKSRDELGLPADRHLYLCPQSLFKLHPDFDAVFQGILERDPLAQIVLIDPRASWAERLQARLAPKLGAHAARVSFTPSVSKAEFLQLLGAADLIIDPFHFGGCNTSCEALALGVPIVTLPAEQLPGRFTLGLYREMALEDCVAPSPAEFVDLAVRLGTQPDYRHSVSERILERCERLFERPDAGAALGAELLRIAGR